MKNSILLVDDDKELLHVYQRILRLKGFHVAIADNAADALLILEKEDISVVISDIIMPKMNGMQLLNIIKEKQPKTEVIMLTAEGSISGAVDAVKEGAFSYFVKPADIEELISNVRKAAELANTRGENFELRERINMLSSKPALIGESNVIQKLRKQAIVIAQSDSAVLISGESGTGKEVFANLIHQNSSRNDKPFICVNCGALNENLIESELFGAEKGAYTGSDKQRKGRFESADGGTIFFDEIGELSLAMQVKLLRVLQEKKFERVGGNETISSDFRLITATNRDLKKEVEKKRFREDLYYRINIIPIEMPPLRERKVEIRLLGELFLKDFSEEMNKKIKPLSDEILACLNYYPWPGNVRELRNIMERLVVLTTDDEVRLEDLPEEIKIYYEDVKAGDDNSSGLKDMTKAYEKELIIKSLEECSGNVSKTAEKMQIARKNLYKKMNEYGIENKK